MGGSVGSEEDAIPIPILGVQPFSLQRNRSCSVNPRCEMRRSTVAGSRSLFGMLLFALVSLSIRVFAQSPERVLYAFTNPHGSGRSPFAPLIADASGNLYGRTLMSKGSQTAGSVYRLSPGPNGWTETLLYVFPTYGFDGYNPNGGLVMDGEGNLYGVTGSGGAYEKGTVYELARLKDGTYKGSVISSFCLYEGSGRNSGLTLDPTGILYGTTASSYLYQDSVIVFRF